LGYTLQYVLSLLRLNALLTYQVGDYSVHYNGTYLLKVELRMWARRRSKAKLGSSSKSHTQVRRIACRGDRITPGLILI
jgi:hypothetical protein